ncbi:MAG: DUF2341 domain-containing protein [Candidatus Thorarchaeota archaeon]|nr:DUF2341 domain-containing protein [Candidatus Thorarchaeota archaeon]
MKRSSCNSGIFILLLFLVTFPSFIAISNTPNTYNNIGKQVDVTNDLGAKSIPVFSQDDWLTGWQYRKRHTIFGSENASSNYQVKIIVNYGEGVDYSNVVNCYERCLPNFVDVRFTFEDGITLLDYWKESFINADVSIFWVEISADLSVDRSIYIYYGNPTALDASNGFATFPLFDDFNRPNSARVGMGWIEDEGGDYDEAWGDADLDISSNTLRIEQEDRQYAHIERAGPPLNEYILQGSFKVSPNCGDDWAPRIHLYWGTFSWVGCGLSNGPKFQYHENVATVHSEYEIAGAVYNKWYSFQVRLGLSSISYYYSEDGIEWKLIANRPRPAGWSGPPSYIMIGKDTRGVAVIISTLLWIIVWEMTSLENEQCNTQITYSSEDLLHQSQYIAYGVPENQWGFMQVRF